MAQHMFKRTILAAALALLGTAGSAQEVEPNYPIGSAQRLTITSDGSSTTGGAVIKGEISLGGAEPDIDFYSFAAKAGDLVTIDIDETTGVTATILTVFGPGPVYDLLDVNDGAALDPGSVNPDPRIEQFYVPQDGVYTVAVSTFPIYLEPGGTYLEPAANSAGPYKLLVSGVSLPPAPPPPASDPVPVPPPPPPAPAVKQVSIDIKPGERKLSPVLSPNKQNVPVALLSSPSFNALQANHTSITFGKKGDEASVKRCGQHGRTDVNRDGLPDLVCMVDAGAAGFVPGDLVGVLKGKTASGEPFEGRGALKVLPVPGKKRGGS